ncbi:putative ATP-dependent RNA helicase [Leptomonas pyrrhocoris]|uniref:RNA helicase n=1 Tax=Leptomonas pyrrhocoris TaxID=157538 RepID=A0A0M9G271_LEPPY|nr:putative ATP-dependent RNA helicase [Leptomonas pyrrhocoris]KPA80835.1 putative ATP-dependent RNA helicase [Leptomonas pyrrhocoris]|eukprot:XP_015659274.1 putative ATP-dependent RNA helicase [Leptomonas pyrrhocoris]
MHRSWKIYVGAEVPATAASTTADSASTQALLDTAFARRARWTLQTASPALRQRPSAAPSPVLRWLLQMANTQTATTVEVASTRRGGLPKGNGGPPSSTETHTSSTPSEMEVAAAATAARPPASTLATTALVRRGVGPKDPLLQRLLKKRQEAESATTTPAPTATPASSSTAAAATATTGSSGVTPSHWTQHSYSAMTPTSWRVFRQQLGITIELVAPAMTVPPLASGSVFPSSAAAAAALPAADTLSAIRCWEEAQLPLTLGRCVATSYALPTAVQAQCVPLALLTSPASLSVSAPLTTTITTTASSLGMDVLAVAETGSGKTAAYLVPLLAHVLCRAPKLLGHPDRISLGPLSLVMVPTRELAEQVTASLLQLCGQAGPSAAPSSSPGVRRSDLVAWEAEENDLPSGSAVSAPERNCLSEFRVVKVVGGESRDAQYDALAQGAHCVVGTVGQLQTLLEDRLLSLGNTQFVVVDEADRMIDEQQEEKLVAVLERCPTPRQTLMFTATLSTPCAGVAKRYLSRSGYYLVRTPYRCASIRQSFELISETTTAAASATDDGSARRAARSLQPPRQQRRLDNTERPPADDRARQPSENPRQQRSLHPLLQPQKFARLVAWLVYGAGPIIVFANAKATCDTLFDELRTEAEYLDAQQEYFTLTDLVGPPPDGLVFREDSEAPSTSSRAATAAAAASPSPRDPSLVNLRSVAVVHSELSQSERRGLVAQFQRRQRSVLITTDLLARGLDVAGVTLVVNYDVPWSATGVPAESVMQYVHRIGRTGRAGSTGVAVTFVVLPAAMVQRAEEVVREDTTTVAGAKSGGDGVNERGSWNRVAARANTNRLTLATAADDDDDDPASLMGELFDGDTRNVWVAGASAAVAGARGGRHRHNDASENEDDAGVDTSDNEEDGSANRGDARSTNKRARSTVGFASDVAVLRPLWSFLMECAEGEGCKDGAAALRRGTYAKISVPPALACIMAQLSATSQFGRITL